MEIVDALSMIVPKEKAYGSRAIAEKLKEIIQDKCLKYQSRLVQDNSKRNY